MTSAARVEGEVVAVEVRNRIKNDICCKSCGGDHCCGSEK